MVSLKVSGGALKKGRSSPRCEILGAIKSRSNSASSEVLPDDFVNRSLTINRISKPSAPPNGVIQHVQSRRREADNVSPFAESRG